MHNKNIELLQEEAQRLLKLELDILEQMRQEPGVLSNGEEGQAATFTAVSTDASLEILKGEVFKLTRLEMVIAVVGTMKAGKSTTINAIVGAEVLPNRNRPMTALPTLIEHTPGQIEPVLDFNNIKPIENLMGKLRDALGASSNKKRLSALETDKDMVSLIAQIRGRQPLPQRCVGADAIFEFLRSLNDLVRISAELDVEFPFDSYAAIHEIPSIKVEFTTLRGTDQAHGKLTLLDTPGPNESGQPHLRKMLRDQLGKASAVLAVLDYSQLKSEADAQVRAELKAIASVSVGRLYALVNKFDQQDRNGDSAEDIQSFVASTLMEGQIGSENVFPVSSKWAYLANRVRNELFVNKCLPDHLSQPWVADFGDEAFGKRWQRQINNLDEVSACADDLWKDSLFQAPMDRVIRFAQSRAAIFALDSASSKLLDTANRLDNFLNTRETALGKSARELQTQIDDIKKDIKRVTSSELAAKQQAKTTLANLEQCSDAVFRQVQREVNDAIEQMFNERKLVEKDLHDKEVVHTSIFKGILHALRPDAPRRSATIFDLNSPIMTFSNRREAEQKLAAAQRELGRITGKGEDDMKSAMSGALAEFQSGFTSKVVSEAQSIISSMSSRMMDSGFVLHVQMPDAATLSLPDSGGRLLDDLIASKTETELKSRRKSGAWGTVCKWFSTDDWGWEDYAVDTEVYTIDCAKIKQALDNNVKQIFEGLNAALTEQIRVPLDQGIDEFFRQFKQTVEHIRGDLLQGMSDINRSKQEQTELVRRLGELKKNIPAIRTDSTGLKDDVKVVLEASTHRAL